MQRTGTWKIEDDRAGQDPTIFYARKRLKMKATENLAFRFPYAEKARMTVFSASLTKTGDSINITGVSELRYDDFVL